MSAEGENNLDNDGAADCLALLSKRLFSRITDLLKHPQGHEYDDEYISELFALVEVVFALNARNLIYSCPPPEGILPLISPYQQRWAEYHTLAGHEPPKERKLSMSKTFGELERIVEAFADRSPTFVKTELDPADSNDAIMMSIFDDLSQ